MGFVYGITGCARMVAPVYSAATVKPISSLERRYGYGLHEKLLTSRKDGSVKFLTDCPNTVPKINFLDTKLPSENFQFWLCVLRAWHLNDGNMARAKLAVKRGEELSPISDG